MSLILIYSFECVRTYSIMQKDIAFQYGLLPQKKYSSSSKKNFFKATFFENVKPTDSNV